MTDVLLDRIEWLVLVWLSAVGACVGSFLNVCIYRLPRRCLSVLRPARSFCPGCRRTLRWDENIPILSWVALRGRCGGCKGVIRARYPLVELLTLVAFAWLARQDLVAHHRVVDPAAWGLFVTHATLVSAFIVCTATDLEFRIIPDEIDVPGIILAPLIVAALPAAFAASPPDVAGLARSIHETFQGPLVWWGLPGLERSLGAFADLLRDDASVRAHVGAFAGSIFGGAVGAGFIWSTGVVGTRLAGQDAMGFGDVKYMGMIGGFAGWQGVGMTLLVAALAGSFGGLLHMFSSGRPRILGRDLDDEELTPIRRLALWLTGARGPAAPDAVLPIRPGTAWLARLATGDPYVPFGPFLTLGAFLAIFFPAATWAGIKSGIEVLQTPVRLLFGLR